MPGPTRDKSSTCRKGFREIRFLGREAGQTFHNDQWEKINTMSPSRIGYDTYIEQQPVSSLTGIEDAPF
jgi:hypothetical protein